MTLKEINEAYNRSQPEFDKLDTCAANAIITGQVIERIISDSHSLNICLISSMNPINICIERESDSKSYSLEIRYVCWKAEL